MFGYDDLMFLSQIIPLTDKNGSEICQRTRFKPDSVYAQTALQGTCNNAFIWELIC